MSAGSSYVNACCLTPRERYCCNPQVSDELASLGARYKDSSQDTLRQSSFLKDVLDLQGHPRDIGGMFEHCSIASHQRRSSEAEDLPVGEIPGHDRQNNT